MRASVVQATSDGNGAQGFAAAAQLGVLPRTTQYTDNSRGQMLSETDALGNVTRYVYYESTFNNAGISAMLGDLVSVTITYDHSPNGKLHRVTQPDGSYLQNTYDGAQRLIAINNQLGQRIDDTLDMAGNRVAENVTDGNGALRRTITRSIDALNRVQQTVGRE